ncbi:MAG: PEGA domain-containing protein, partial [Myxococcota bacterium]
MATLRPSRGFLPVAIGLWMATIPAAAQEPGSSVANESLLQEAKQLFREGNELRKAAKFERALLERYNRSRALVPSTANTLNAAYCLERLGRLDMALELYEELLAKFGQALDAEERAAVVATIEKIRPSLGALDVSANVNGTLVIDGRMRGQLPLSTPIRLMPGEHIVRVIKDGYVTFETRVTTRANRAAKLDARLRPLASAGRLRVASQGAEGATLFVDGAPVGTLPWEGTLSPGRHAFWIQMNRVGTAPRVVVVVEGQTALVAPKPQPLVSRVQSPFRTLRTKLDT